MKSICSGPACETTVLGRTDVGGMLIMYVSQVTSLLTSDAAGMEECVCHLVCPDNCAL